MYIIWNESTSGSEFFGATKSEKRAKRLLKRILRERYPGIKGAKLEEEQIKSGEDYKIQWFENLI